MTRAEREQQTTRRWRSTRWVGLALVLGLTAPARAQYGASAQRERPLAATNDEDPTAAGTTLDLQHRQLSLETLNEVMREVPGTRPVTGGGYGAFSSVSLRGTQLGHTVWVLGEVPLNTPDSGAFDMSTLPISLLGSLEVFRGGAPAWYSQGAIGGVVRVTPSQADDTGVAVSAGGGSFGRYEGRAASQVITPDVQLRTGLQVSHADNDYSYSYEGLDGRAENGERSFRNADVLDASGLIHLQVPAGPGELQLVTLGLSRAGGVPGPGINQRQTRDTHRNYLSGLASVAYTQQGHAEAGYRRYRLQVLASVRAEHNHFQDPLGEFGLTDGENRRATWWRSTLRAAASYRPVRWLEASLIGSFGHDRFDSQDAALPRQPTSTRNTEAVTGELRLIGRLGRARAELRGSARLEVNQAVLDYEVPGRSVRERKTQLAPTYRVAAVVEAMPGLSVRGSFATGMRVPSILELFGDAGFVRGNAEDLAPEQGVSADLGLVLSGNIEKLAGTLELNGFVQRVDDIIVWHTTNQNQLIAKNSDEALIPGLELGLSGCFGRHLSLDGAATLLDAKNTTTDTQLPRRPRARVFGRPEVSFFTEARALSRISVFGSVDYQTTFYAAPGNKRWQPARTFLGAGATLAGFEERLALTFRADNLADVHAVDYFRFWLPGRSFSALLTYKQEI